ncbi:MAG TPA: tRNA 2-thiouridine(34) synthase MnmA, partial [Candidatus Parcubacteria bacterium]|nr:tRNA 2-thiouridine(34) synthase MnmA [Candidatus Parcubacteria bacterium]
MGKKLDKAFYLRPALILAKELLGKYIVRKVGRKFIIGKIVETEAYVGPKDKAAHTYNWKKTERNKAEYLKGGHIYIYLVYGMHWQLNITAANSGDPECVLVRAIDPVVREEMSKRMILSNGPGKLCRYLKLDKSFYGEDLIKSKRIWLEDSGEKIKGGDVLQTKRVGIDYAGPYWSKRKWRFLIKDYEKYLAAPGSNSKKRIKKREKVVVAMSGGVDSSVAAKLLQEKGYDVVGVFMKFWRSNDDKKEKAENRRCSSESEKKARETAAKLNIPFYVFDFSREFKKEVVDYFLKEEKLGRTPNPCVVCNKKIKTDLLLRKALQLGADYIATGHYVLRKEEKKAKKTIYQIFEAKDKNKDQSYFLWQLKQKDVSKILFPVGYYRKKEIRAIAKKFGFPSFDSPESQEICFIKKTTEEFLKRYLKTKKGEIVDQRGRRVGEHQGLWFYTIGQRKGIGLAGGPYWV